LYPAHLNTKLFFLEYPAQPKMSQMTLWPPGVCPPESTTPTFSGLVTVGLVDDTSDTEGWPNMLGKSLAISSPAELAGSSTTEKLDQRMEGRGSMCRRIGDGSSAPMGDIVDGLHLWVTSLTAHRDDGPPNARTPTTVECRWRGAAAAGARGQARSPPS